MDYTHWRFFVDTAEQGSLSKTALLHDTGQPFVSKKIAELENRCGGHLFMRTGRGVVLTELGRMILPKAKQWLADTQALQEYIQSLNGQTVGHIRLGALPSTITPLVIPLYEQLAARYPLVRLAVHEGQGAQLETWLEEGHIDMALLFRHRQIPGGGDQLLSTSPTWLVSRRGDALTQNDIVDFKALDNLPLITFCRPNSWRDELARHANEEGVRLNIIAEADSLTMQAQIVSAGKAYALLGTAALESIRPHHALSAARIIRPELCHHLVLGYSPYGKPGKVGSIIMELVRQIAGKHPQ